MRRDRGQTMPGRFRNGRAVARLAALLICAGAIATAQASAQGPPPAPYQREGATVKLAAHVYAIPDFKVGMVPNVGIVVDTKGAQGATPGSMLVDEFSAK